MNDDKAAEEIATKVNYDDKNVKKKLEETKKFLKHINRNIKNCFINMVL